MDGQERFARSRADLDTMNRLALLADTAEPRRFLATLEAAAADWNGHWPWAGYVPARALANLEPAAAAELRALLEQRLSAAAPQQPLSGFTLPQLLVVFPALTAVGDAVARARTTVAAAERQWICGYDLDIAAALLLVRSHGEPLSAAMIATLRRETSHTDWRELAGVAELPEAPPLNPGEVWAETVLEFLTAADPAWTEFFAHLGVATKAKPSARWTNRTRDHLRRLDSVTEPLLSWLRLVGQPRTVVCVEFDPQSGFDINEQLDPHNARFLRGLIWTAGLLKPETRIVRELARLVDYGQAKLRGAGVRSQLVTNAAILALSTIDDPEAVGQLARLAVSVKAKPTLKSLNAALDRRADALGVSRDEIEELSIPTYGLTGVGTATGTLGASTWEIEVGVKGTKLLWRNGFGKIGKTPSAAIRRDHPEAVSQLRRRVKDLATMVSAQVERLDRQFLAQRAWRFDAWRERYLDHPVVGTVARRLIWNVDGTAVAWLDGELRDVDGRGFAPADTAVVELWHPIGRDTAEVLAWRDLLERHGITQPFKQAHREVYLLTAAERRTRFHSNRFAAHILRQHQFHALTKARGWENRLRLVFDADTGPTVKRLPRWGLRAEFELDVVGDRTTDVGTHLWLSSDRVRFFRDDSRRPQQLADVPLLVLSEVLRDLDLFVGVSSVGNDPEWSNDGRGAQHRDYWHSYSFGDLSATALTRRALLERLVPRLAIADRAEIDGRFLRVRGDLRTYKIHLGSGNILMEPDNAYLCVVPDQLRAAPTVYLPFEGDRTLSVILSKALLLAKDATITDPSIVSQLGLDPRMPA